MLAPCLNWVIKEQACKVQHVLVHNFSRCVQTDDLFVVDLVICLILFLGAEGLRVFRVVKHLNIFYPKYYLVVIALFPVVNSRFLHFYGKNRVGVVVRMDENRLKIGQLHVDFDHKSRLVEAAFVLLDNLHCLIVNLTST